MPKKWTKTKDGIIHDYVKKTLPKNKPLFKFSVSSKRQLYDDFLELYPDMARQCWGFDGFNWDSQRRSILIRMCEDPLEMGTRILFEVNKDQNGNWSIFRTLLVPFLATDSEGKLCCG